MLWGREQPTDIIRLGITLLHVEPKVARRMDVPADTDVDCLHLYIQAAMGWKNNHTWWFDAYRYGQKMDWCDIDWDEKYDTTLRDIIAFLQGKQEFLYTYDFTDCWEHRIRIGKSQPVRGDRRYPYLVSGTGRCPLEEIGGPRGHAEFLKARDDADSEYRDYFTGPMAWDPDDAQLDARRASLGCLP